MEIEVFEQFLFDAGADAVAEECAVRDDDSGSTGFGRTLELAHDQLKKEQRGFGSLFVFGEVAEDTALFFAAERRVGHDDIDPVFIADFSQRKAETVQWVDLR